MCVDCDWRHWLEQIEDMNDDERCRFAYDTLSGIEKWVGEHEHISDAQVQAVRNIDRASHRF